jgi:ABC-type transport system involved in cytochrome bd biosynthesis fused ATPase/permease subunit
MSWRLVKLSLSKFWLWLKKNWKVTSIVVLSLIVVLLMKRDKKMVVESLKIAQESYKNQIDALNESYEKEEQRRAEADENYKNTVEKIEKDYLKEKRKLNSRERKRLQEILKTSPDDLDKLIEDEFGFEKV